jgi:hypothetical protein
MILHFSRFFSPLVGLVSDFSADSGNLLAEVMRYLDA